MILVTVGGREHEVFRQNLSYQDSSGRNWNINPFRILQDPARQTGFFVIAQWGTVASEEFERMIRVDAVVEIRDPHDWEMPTLIKKEVEVFEIGKQESTKPTIRKLRE